MTLGSCVGWVEMLVPQVQEGGVPVDHVIRKPLIGREAAKGARVDSGVVTGVISSGA